MDRRPSPIQFRDKEIEQLLGLRTHEGASRSQTAERDLRRYYDFVVRSLPTFTVGEAALIVDALNGTLITHETAPLLWAEIDDAIRVEQLDQKWSVDGAGLVERLRSMTPFERLAVVDAAERFWIGSHQAEGTLDDQLRAVGLVKRPSDGF